MKECRERHIPITVMRLRDKQDKEWLRLFRKSPLSRTEWITKFNLANKKGSDVGEGGSPEN